MGEELKQKEELSDILFETNTAKVIVDEKSDIVRTNKAFREMFGLAVDTRGNIRDILNISSEQDVDNENNVKNFKLLINGENIIVNITNTSRGAIWELFNRDVENKTFSIRDEQLTAQQKLINQFESLMKIRSHGIYIFDVKKNEYSLISPSIRKILNYTEEEFMEIQQQKGGITSLIHQDDKERFKQYWENIKNSEKTNGNIKFHMKKKNDGFPEMRDDHVLIRDENTNEVVNIVGIVSDVSKEEQYKDSIEVVRRILHHDLLNKVALIAGLRNSDEGYDNIDVHIKSMKNLIDKLSHTIKNLVESKNLYILNLDEVIENVITDFRTIHKDINISYESYHGNSLKRILANDLIYQVFDNIINNAIRHGGDVKNIKITLKKRTDPNARGGALLEIYNDGEQINPKNLYKIFNDGVKFGQNAHTGQGLHIVEKILADYNCSIFAENVEEKGVKFVIMLRNIL